MQGQVLPLFLRSLVNVQLTARYPGLKVRERAGDLIAVTMTGSVQEPTGSGHLIAAPAVGVLKACNLGWRHPGAHIGGVASQWAATFVVMSGPTPKADLKKIGTLGSQDAW